MSNFGNQVRVVFTFGEKIFRNVTEIHWHYNIHIPGGELRVAFESDIHSCGATYATKSIIEMETSLETEKAENF